MVINANNAATFREAESDGTDAVPSHIHHPVRENDRGARTGANESTRRASLLTSFDADWQNTELTIKLLTTKNVTGGDTARKLSFGSVVTGSRLPRWILTRVITERNGVFYPERLAQ